MMTIFLQHFHFSSLIQPNIFGNPIYPVSSIKTITAAIKVRSCKRSRRYDNIVMGNDATKRE